MAMTDARLAAHIEGLAKQTSGLSDSKLGDERQRVQRYYDGLEPKPMHGGDSKYISMDVYDSVESMAAQLLETFSGNSSPINFAPQGPEDAEHARQANDYIPYAIFRQNSGFDVMQTVIRDGLMNRIGVAKVWWDESETEEDETVEEVPYADFEAMLASDPDAQLTDLDLDSETQVVRSATLVRRRDTSQVRIEVVPPEEFGITRRAKSLEDADLVMQRTLQTADQLKAMGVSEKILKELHDDTRQWQDNDGDKVDRFSETDDGLGDWGARENDDNARQIDVIEAYAKLDLDGRVKLWRLLVAGHRVLLKSQVKRVPFVIFTPLPRQHSFWGSNFASKVIPTQNARTLLTRSIINHALITNNPRIGVVKGGLINPKELVENRLGGVVNLTNPNALVPIQQTGLNPFIFNTIELLDAKKEETTGVSRLSQGLSKDAVSKQNSADMVDGLIGRSMIRQKVVARNFAEKFLKPLFLEVYRLIVENEQAERIIEVAGAWQAVDPTAWPDRKDVVAEVSVGYGEQDKIVQKWLSVDTYLAQDPRFAPVYDANRRYHVISQVLKAMGIKDVNSVVADPSTVEPPQPDPKIQAELENMQAQTASANSQAQVGMEKVKLEAQRMQLEHEREMLGIQLKHQADMAKLELEKLKLQQQRETAQAELALAQEANAAGNLQGIASPT
ncbi:portal protein [Roseomonas sp. WA12]